MVVFFCGPYWVMAGFSESEGKMEGNGSCWVLNTFENLATGGQITPQDILPHTLLQLTQLPHHAAGQHYKNYQVVWAHPWYIHPSSQLTLAFLHIKSLLIFLISNSQTLTTASSPTIGNTWVVPSAASYVTYYWNSNMMYPSGKLLPSLCSHTCFIILNNLFLLNKWARLDMKTLWGYPNRTNLLRDAQW